MPRFLRLRPGPSPLSSQVRFPAPWSILCLQFTVTQRRLDCGAVQGGAGRLGRWHSFRPLTASRNGMVFAHMPAGLRAPCSYLLPWQRETLRIRYVGVHSVLSAFKVSRARSTAGSIFFCYASCTAGPLSSSSRARYSNTSDV